MITTQKHSVPISTPSFEKRQTNYQPNIFTESRQEFTELEKKIVVLVINQIGHMALKQQIVPGANVLFQIPFTELTKARYDQISAAADTLQLKRLKYRNDKTKKFDYIVPFPRVRSELVDGKRVVELTMFADVVPHFAELGQRYTKYECDVMLSLSSVYAQRMFEIVSMYSNRGQKQFVYSVAELRDILNCPDSYRYVDFKINALELAKRELQQKAGITLDWIPSRKEGKKIIELTFFIKTAHQLAIEGVKQDQLVVNNMSINEAVATSWQLMKAYKLKDWQKDLIASERELLEIFYRVDSELANGLRNNIKNPTAYLVKSLGIDQVKAPASRTKEPRAKSVTATTRTDVPSARKGTTQLVGDLFGDIIGSK